MNEPAIPDATRVLPFQALTPRPLRELLTRARPEGPVVALGQSAHTHPVGLVLAQGCTAGQVSKIEWLYVDPLWRNQGIASALLNRLQELCAGRGCPGLAMTYFENRSSTAALARVLDKAQWDRSTKSALCLVMGDNVRRLLDAPWVRTWQLPHEFTVQPWHEVPRQELDRLYEEHQRQRVYEEYLSPFTPCYERDYSLALRHEGRLIGWIITQRASPRILRYEFLFVRREYRRRGVAIALLLEAIRRHYTAEQHLLPDAGAAWFTHKTNLPMMHFIRRRLTPYLTNVYDLTFARKQIAVSLPFESRDPFGDENYVLSSSACVS